MNETARPFEELGYSGNRPALTIAVPAYNRPVGLGRLLESLQLECLDGDLSQVEVLIADDSDNMAVEQVFDAHFSNLPTARARYLRNSPRLGMAQNWNRCIQESTGSFVLILHDDDRLLPGSVHKILQTTSCNSESVVLFGVLVESDTGKVLKRQTRRKDRWMSPREGVKALATNSSLVRFPGMVISREAYLSEVGFASDVGYAADVDMWVRLVAKHGLFLSRDTTAVYQVHPGALTNNMFTNTTVADLEVVFTRIRQTGLLTDSEVQLARTRFMHQFLLAGSVRSLRIGKVREARRAMELLKTLSLGGWAGLRFSAIRLILEILLRPARSRLSRTGGASDQ